MSTPFRVLISDDMSSRAEEILSACNGVEVTVKTGLAPSDLQAIIGDFEGLLVRSATKVTADIISSADNLKVIGRAGIGVDNIDLAAASARGIAVQNAPSGNSVTTAEHALSLMMSLARHVPQATASMKAGKWEKKKFKGVELMDKTVGVIGLGNIGRIFADRARGLKMKVIGYDPYADAKVVAAAGIELIADLDELLARADVISIHTPLTDSTRKLINADTLAKMKPKALLVCAARGGIVDEDALLAALENGHLHGAALDVYETEPPAADMPLLAHPRLICTPHLGASTAEAQIKVAVQVAEQFVAFVERGEIENQVNG